MNAQELALLSIGGRPIPAAQELEVEKSGESVVRMLNICERILKRVGPGSIIRKKHVK